MYWHGVRVWVVAFGPEEVCEVLGDRQRGSDLSSQSWVSEKGKPEGRQSLTVTQKNRTKNAMNRNGISNHPTPLRTAKNPISIGSVTTKSVPMTSFRLGFLLPSSRLFKGVEADGRADAIE